MAILLIILSIVLFAAVAVLSMFIGLYNGFVQKRNDCDREWSQIEVQLKRRHDLIPNLVETVKGYASHEKDTLEQVISARNKAASSTGSGVAAQAQAEGALSGALRQLFAVAEAYPDLKANQNFLALQTELSATENFIAGARQGYNDVVATYNSAIQAIPGNIVAGFGGFTKKEFFALSAEEKAIAETAPKVSF